MAPETSKIGEKLREAGETGRREFEQGFASGGSSTIFDSMTSQLGSKISAEVSAGLQRGLSGMELPGGLSRVTEGLMRGFEGVTAHTEKAEAALHDYERAHQQLTAALEREAVAQARLDDLHAKGAQGGQLAAGLASVEAAHRRVAQAADADTEAHEALQKTMDAGSSKMLTFAASTGIVSGAISGGIMLGAEAISKMVEAAVEGFKEIVEGVEEVVEHVVEVGEQFEELHRSIELSTLASGSSLEELKVHSDALAGSLDTAFDKVGTDMATFASRLDMEASPALDRLTKHVEELRDRFGSLDASALAGAFNQFEISGDHADQALASLVHTSREYGVSLNQLINDLTTAGPALQEFDLTIEQSGHLLGELESRHINAAAAVNALTRAEKGAADQHMELKDFVQQELTIIEHYRDTNNKAAAEQEALLAFGTKNWMQATTAARQYLETVAAGKDAFKGNTAETDHLIASTQSLENRWTALRNSMTTTFAPVASLALEGINNAVSKLGEWIQAHEGEVLDFVKHLGEDFINAIPAVQDFAAKTIDTLEPWLKIIQQIFGAATEVFGELVGIASQLDKNPMFKKLFGDWSKELKDAADTVTRAGAQIRDFDLGKTLEGWSTSIKGFRPDIQGWTKDLDESTEALKKQLDALNNSKSAIGDGEGGAPPGDIGHIAPPAKSFEPGGGSGGDPDPDVGGADSGGADSGGGEQPGDDSGATPVAPRSWHMSPPPNDGVGGPQHVVMAGWHPHVEQVDQYTETGGGAPKNPGERHTEGGHHGDARGHHEPPRVGSTPAQDRAHSRRLEDLSDKISDDDDSITDLTQRQSEASGKVQHDKALRDSYTEGSLAWIAENKELIKDSREYQRVTKELTRTLRDRKRSEEDIADENTKYGEEQHAKHGGKGGEGSPPAGDFGKQFLGGIASDLGLGGIFGKSPLEWGLPKLAESILGAFTGADNSSGGDSTGSSGGDSGGSSGNPLSNWMRSLFGDHGEKTVPDAPHLGTGAPPGPVSPSTGQPSTAPGPAQGVPHLPGGAPAAPGPAAPSITPGAPTPTPIPTPHVTGTPTPGMHYAGYDGGGGAASGGVSQQYPWSAMPAVSGGSGGVSGAGAVRTEGAFAPTGAGGQGAQLAGFHGGGRADVAKYIYAAAKSRGYSDGDSRNIVAYSVGESGLNPGISGGVQRGVGDKGGAADEVQGLFQEKPGFAQAGGVDPSQRGTVDGNVTAYLNNLEKHRNDPGDIDDHLLATSSGGPMYTGGRQAMSGLLGQVQGLLGDNPDVSDYLSAAGGGGAPMPVAVTPGGFPGGAMPPGMPALDNPNSVASRVPNAPNVEAGIRKMGGLPTLYDTSGANAYKVPGWANALGGKFGLDASTYASGGSLHQMGYAFDYNARQGDPQGQQKMDAFADYIQQNLSPQTLQLIHASGDRRWGIASGQDVSATPYYAGDYGGHHDHVHWATDVPPIMQDQPAGVDDSLIGAGSNQFTAAGFQNTAAVPGPTGPTPAMGNVPNVNPMGPPHYTGPKSPGPMQQPQQNVSTAPNIQMNSGGGSNFAQATVGNFMSGMYSLIGSQVGGPDVNPKSWQGRNVRGDGSGILQEPDWQGVQHQHTPVQPVQPITHNIDNSINLHGTTLGDTSDLQQKLKEEQMSRYYSASGGLPMSGIGSP